MTPKLNLIFLHLVEIKRTYALFRLNSERLMPTLKKKYFISFDQNISSEEFMNILYNYNVFFPKDKIEEVLIYLGIPDINAFSLNFMHLIEIIMFIVRIISIKSRKIKRI